MKARLADARFFYGEDRKASLAARAARLEHLVFHERLGTYAAKTERIGKLAEWICRALGRPEDVGAAKEASSLLKVDLTTEMVKEFTTLQGVMGGIYAREDGHGAPVWQAGPNWSTLSRRVSPSQSTRAEIRCWWWPEVAPLVQASWRERDQ